MFWNQLVLGDVDQKILLDKHLHTALGSVAQALDTAQKSESHARHGLNGNHDARVKLSVDQVIHVVAQLLQAGVFVAVKLDPDGADGGLGVGILLRRGRRVLDEHLFAGLAGKVEARAAAESQYGPEGPLALSHAVSTYSGSPSSRAYLPANCSSDMVMSSSMTRYPFGRVSATLQCIVRRMRNAPARSSSPSLSARPSTDGSDSVGTSAHPWLLRSVLGDEGSVGVVVVAKS
jgi:hypothetical protein